MTKTVTAFGGPADGKEFSVNDEAKILFIPVIDSEYKVEVKENLFAEVIGWDDYGPIFDRSYIKQARYRITGDRAVYET